MRARGPAGGTSRRASGQASREAGCLLQLHGNSDSAIISCCATARHAGEPDGSALSCSMYNSRTRRRGGRIRRTDELPTHPAYFNPMWMIVSHNVRRHWLRHPGWARALCPLRRRPPSGLDARVWSTRRPVLPEHARGAIRCVSHQESYPGHERITQSALHARHRAAARCSASCRGLRLRPRARRVGSSRCPVRSRQLS